MSTSTSTLDDAGFASAKPLAVEAVPVSEAESPLVSAVSAEQVPLVARRSGGKSREEIIRARVRGVLARVLPPIAGIVLFLLLWQILSAYRADLPGPLKTWDEALVLFANPFYINSPNDVGIGWNIVRSLQRVGLGFGLAALVGIPVGFIVGRSRIIAGMLAPIMGLLRPVSPLAWLPIGLLVFQKAEPASIWVIFISSIWPMIMNTSAGVRQIPQDYLNVARVLNLSEWKIFTTILFPAVLPYLITGIRLAIGVAWLVIVAAEMLTGGTGLGFWVWDEWNNLNVAHIIIAIFLVGFIGLILEQSLMLLARRFSYGRGV